MHIRVGLSGTPGVGKTTLAKLAKMHGWEVISVKSLAKSFGFLGEEDPTDGAREVDVDALAEKLGSNWQAEGERILVDGHLSHLLPVDALVILRCHPDVLRTRLGKRGWSESKIRENVEWELMGGPHLEIHAENPPIPILEMDASTTSSQQIWDSMKLWLEADCPIDSEVQPMDWMGGV